MKMHRKKNHPRKSTKNLLQFFQNSIFKTISKKNSVKKYTFHFLKNKTLSQTPKKSKIAVIAVKIDNIVYINSSKQY